MPVQRATQSPPDDSSFGRGLRVLLAVSDWGPLRADALAERLETPVSTTYRYLRTLKELGLVEERAGMYMAGLRFGSGSPDGLSHAVLAQVAQPLLRSLSERTGETAVLVVRAGGGAICVEQVVSRHPMRMAFEVGQVLPLHAGAASRVLLAHTSPQLIDRVLSAGLPRYTTSTPDRAKLERQMENTRLTGFATSRGEFIEGAFAVAVPVFASGQVAAGLALAGPATRCTHAWQSTVKPMLAEAGSTLSAALES